MVIWVGRAHRRREGGAGTPEPVRAAEQEGAPSSAEWGLLIRVFLLLLALVAIGLTLGYAALTSLPLRHP